MIVNVKKLNEDAQLPVYAHPGEDAGMDVVATSCEYNEEMDCYIYGTGLAFEVPKGYVMLIFPRSSNRKTNCYMANSVGVLDSGYRGELMISMKSRTGADVIDAIADLMDTVDANADASEDHISEKFYHTDDNQISVSAPYKVGDRIAQIIILPYPQIEYNVVDELSESNRGDGGHGSTGA